MLKRITLSEIRQSPSQIGVLIGLIVVLMVVLIRGNGGLQFLDLLTYDLLITANSTRTQMDNPVTLVSITEGDIGAFGEWPLSDATLSKALRHLEEAGASAIGVDIYRDRPVPPGASELKETLLGNNRIVIVKKFGTRDTPGVRPPAYLVGTSSVGFSDTVVDPGGVARRGLLFLDDEDGVSFGLALRLAMTYLADHGVYLQPGEPDPSFIRFGDVTIPPFEGSEGPYVNADAAGYQLLLDYRDGRSAFPAVTLSELFNGDFAADVFENKVVVVGVAAVSVKDDFFTPFSKGLGRSESIPGIMVHAYLASQLIRAGLQGDRPLMSASELQENLWVLLWGLLGCSAGLLVHSFLRLSVLMVAGVATIIAVAYAMFNYGWWISIVPAGITWLVSAALVTAYLSAYERKQRGVLMQLFAKHVSTDVADEIWKNREQYFSLGRLRSQKLTATVLFSDIEHFTTVSEKLGAEALMEWLNSYMEVMANLVIEHGGVVDDLHGDAIMAVFGVPVVRTTDAEIREDAMNAVRCARAMSKAIDELNKTGKEQNAPHLRIRLGICTGSVVAGCLGSSERMKYTTIGDTVNTAARIENMDKESFETESGISDCRILLAASTIKATGKGLTALPVGHIVLRGKTEPVQVFRVDGVTMEADNVQEKREVSA